MKKKILFTIIVLFLLTFVFCINYFSSKYDFQYDVTKYKQHTLSLYADTILSQLKDKIHITALFVGVPPKYLEDLFDQFEKASSGKVKAEIIDPLVNLGYASRFGNIIKGEEKKVVVQKGNERRDIDFTDEPLTEEHLINAILRVTQKAKVAYFLSGHGEYDLYSKDNTGLSSFAKLLLANNVISKQLLLGKGEAIPSDCDVLVIAGPQKDFNESDINAVESFLEKGGDALFLIEHTVVTTPDKPLTEEELNKNPSLNNILENWGVSVANDIVVDLDSHAGQDVGSPATKNYMPHPQLLTGLDYTFYVRPRSIKSLKRRRPKVKTVPFVLTSEKNSWGETNRELDVRYDEGVDRAGPVPISYVVFEEKEEGDFSDTRILIFTDADFLSNAYIESYSNAQMGLNLINWLSESDYRFYLNKKDLKQYKMNLTSKQKKEVVVVLVIMPLMILATGLIVYFKTK